MEDLRILLVDDHALFRGGIASLIASRPGLKVVGEACNGLHAVEQAQQLLPNLILMDIDMAICNGLEATRKIKEKFPSTKIVILTVSDDDDCVFEAIKSGASGYILKDTEPKHFLHMLEKISAGEAPISGVIATRILEELALPSHDKPHSVSKTAFGESNQGLTTREIEVLKFLAKGKSNAEIAACLVITENTVKNHLRKILQKLHLKNRVQLAVYAIENDIP